MGIETSELPRLEFSNHEMFVLHYAKEHKPIPADPDTLSLLIDEKLIRPTDRRGINELTELGELACVVLRSQIAEVVP